MPTGITDGRLFLQLSCGSGTIYTFHGVEMDETRPDYEKKVVVFAFKSTESGFFFLCARDTDNVALLVVILRLH